MNIAKKIEEIRQQPENIRLRWVWGCVALSMFFIFVIWIFSITAMLRQNAFSNPSSTVDDLKKQFEGINQNSPSLKDFSDEKSLNIGNDSAAKVPSDAETFPNAGDTTNQNTTNNSNDSSQSSSYSDLQNN